MKIFFGFQIKSIPLQKNQDEVADLFQEVLINLWKSMPTFEGRSNVRSWIYRVSLNVCISRSQEKTS